MEMNIHVAQSLQTRNELVQLAAVPYQILTPKDSKPIVSIVQDVALGVYRISKSAVFVSEKQLYNLLATNPKFMGNIPLPGVEDGSIQKWSGRQLLSTIIPSNVNYRGANKSFDEKKNGDNENFVVVENGDLKQGIVDTKIYQDRTKGLIHSIYNEYGPDETRMFFDNTQQLICNWLVLSGFSVGISDLVIDANTMGSLKEIIHDMKVKVHDVIRDIHMHKFQNNSRRSNNDKFEEEVNNLLNETTKSVGNVSTSKINDIDNRMINMIKSGSKGNAINIAQMVACLGQQSVDGKRIAYGFESRTLPHYTKYDDGPEARGFVENSFIKGLTPQEFFFHSMGGREGLIDTAVKSVTGDTPIIVMENGVSKYVKIGDWIDSQLDDPTNTKNVQHFTERQMEYLELDNPVYIPTTDEDGHVTWGAMTAITRHDPGTELYQIKTLGGKSVIVTESKSLLTWNESERKFKEVPTPEIKVGDFVPVTANLMAPPTVVTSIDMTAYFPKTEYVYGTDFNLATKCMQEAMENRGKIPAGWWDNNNGTTFTLPYSKKSSLARATSGRSNVDNIVDGCVYPYNAGREHGHFPATFEFSHDNGVFIGLYLAEGNAHGNTVQITNINESVKSFVKTWFEKHSISSREVSKINNAGGTSSGVIGNSSLLSTFLTDFVGHGSHHKHVPDVAFVAPDEFILGILNGYMSGDGTISSNSVECSSASPRLTEGIAMLCSRLGIFGKVFVTQTKSNNFGTKDIAASHRLSIRAQWARLFADKVTLVHDGKQEQLRKMQSPLCHRNFALHNDVVLDKITEITILGVEAYPKVYDVTVPSTLNFGLANGLQVRDTSTTGYIQRKLVKAMEDCKVSYDLTVRNANGNIVQFLYGEDGMDAVKLETQHLQYITMDPSKLESEYLLSVKDNMGVLLDKDTQKAFINTDGWQERLYEHYAQIVRDRDFLIKDLFQNIQETMVVYPVSFTRIINNTQALYKKYQCSGVLSDLNPLDVLDEIERLIKELFVTNNNKGNKLLSILLRMYLSPKQLILRYGFNRTAFEQVVQQVKMRFFDAIVNPSEMVGVVAAQSIGEPCTQMTLNSVDWHTELLLDVNGKLQRVKIGDFIDKEIIAATRKENHPSDTTLGWVEHKNIKVLSCDEDGHVDWQLVEAVTKHPPINKDGTNTLLKVVTDSGREVIATKAKSFLKRVNNKIIEVPGEEIKIGDYLPVSNKLTINRAITHWDVSDTLSKHDFVFMTEVEKAKKLHKNKTSRWWFSKCQGKDFTVPYSRSDSFVDAFIGIGQREPRREQIIKQRDGCVYPKTCIRQPAHIPEMIPLDAEFGFFVGAYLAEGNCTDYHTMISNIDDTFNARIEQFCARYDIGYHVIDKITNGGRSKTIRMHSQVLTQMMSKNCGRVSYEKRIPAELLAAPDVFLRNMVDGYMSGDGTVSQKDNRICASSVSKGLLEDFQQLFTQYGIQTKIHAVPSALKIALEKGMDARMSYCLSIATAYIEAYRSLFTFTLTGKQEKLENMTSVAEFSRCDTIPDVVTKKYGTITVHRSRIDDLISMCGDSPEDVQILNDIKNEDIIYDKIVSVEEIPSSHDHVYDLTVANTRNFNIWNGLALKDTFHLSGVASASKSVRGVPRIEELTRVTKNVKAPSMTVFIRPEFNQDKTKCLEIKNKLEITTFKDIIKFSRIYYDADDFNTDIAEDKRLVQLYSEYNFDLEGETNNKNLSPWLLRMELDKVKMLDIGLTMIDLHHTMYDHFQDRVSCMFSDDNAGDLVFRIRLNQDASADKSSDMLTDLKALESTIIETIMLKGIEKVKKVELIKKDGLKYNPDTQVFEKKFEWALDTDGTNLMEMLGSPYIDPYRTVSNDINEIYAIFGVEAARQALFNELNSVIKDAEASVNFRHLSLLVDTMTLKGGLMSIDRHGINKGDIGPLAKCSFEEVNDVLVKAGVFAEVDRVNGVSANIILGQIAPCGTGDTEILIDEQKLKAPSQNRAEGHAFNTSMLQFDDEQKDSFCGMDNLDFDFAVPDADMSIQKKPSVAVKFV